MMNNVFALIVDDAQDHSEPDIRSLTPDLTTLQMLVDGSVEAVYGYREIDGTVSDQPRITFYLNDEGKLRGLPPNPLATALWWHFNPSAVHADFLVGPVIVTGYDPAGHDTDVPEDVIDTIVALAYSSAST
jgi:Domain of unknown function (DUF3846)